MLRSMTGFGEAAEEIAGSDYSVEIRSVNNRYFKAIVRLPEMWADLEADVEQRLRRRLYRGSIHCRMHVRSLSAEAAYDVNVAALERYIDQIEVIRPDQSSDVKLSIDLGSLLQLPGVCTPPAGDEPRQQARAELIALTDRAIDALLAMRAEEGQTIAADLLANCERVAGSLAEIAERAPGVVRDYHQRLARRVAELTASAELELEAPALAREVALFAERCDVAEELSRMKGHLKQFHATMTGEERPGRKLDFIAQEMLREANTISSKANDVEIVRHVVDVKTAIDRIKEQVQNVE